MHRVVLSAAASVSRSSKASAAYQRSPGNLVACLAARYELHLSALDEKSLHMTACSSKRADLDPELCKVEQGRPETRNLQTLTIRDSEAQAALHDAFDLHDAALRTQSTAVIAYEPDDCKAFPLDVCMQDGALSLVIRHAGRRRIEAEKAAHLD